MADTQMFNVRLEFELFDAIDKAAEDAGVTRSVWAREVLASVALGGVTLEQLRDLVQGQGQSPHPGRYLPLQGRIGRSERLQASCIHPPTAVTQLPFTDVCGLCGKVLRRR